MARGQGVRGGGARRLERPGFATLKTHAVWADCEGLAGSGQDSDMVTSALRKNPSGCCAENGLARMGLGTGRPGRRCGSRPRKRGWCGDTSRGNAENPTGEGEGPMLGVCRSAKCRVREEAEWMGCCTLCWGARRIGGRQGRKEGRGEGQSGVGVTTCGSLLWRSPALWSRTNESM